MKARISQEAITTTSIIPVIISSKESPDHEVITYAILDSGSDATFIDEDTIDALKLSRSNSTKLTIETLSQGDKREVKSSVHSNLQIRGYNSDKLIALPPAYSIPEIPTNPGSIPAQEDVSRWPHLNSLKNCLPPSLNCGIGLLVGHNCWQALIPRQTATGRDDEPFGVRTDLGWMITGPKTPSATLVHGIKQDPVTTLSCHRIITKEVQVLKPIHACQILEMDFSKDEEGTKTSQDDIKFMKILEGSARMDESGHLEMPLPFKHSPNLQSNRQAAYTRLLYLKRKLQKDENLKKEYCDFMDTIISRNDAEETVGGEEQEWYLPHHGVIHPKKRKLRVVFDCSASSRGTSLNDQLLAGPNLINDLVGVFIRFRRYEVAFAGDVEKMFHAFHVQPDDRKFLKFLWWKNGDLSQEPTVYRMNVHLFGAASSPGCANFGLKYLARMNQETLPEAARFVKNDFYVDDGLTSVPTTEEAISIIKGAIEICKSGGLRLHKFASNEPEVVNSLPESERSENTQVQGLKFVNSAEEKTLGMEWCMKEDMLRFARLSPSSPSTRRGILSTVASLYDPLGLISPFTLIGKLILQETCATGTKWDELIPQALEDKWNIWIGELEHLPELLIPRCYAPKGFGKPKEAQLHHFADASSNGYGMCSYLRLVNHEGEVHCALVASKARVAPLKAMTIPRLELTAALLAAKVGTSIKESLQMDINEEHYWSDSQVTLGYIQNDAKRFHIFVANRVQTIKNLTKPQQWHHVSTLENPADHASRGLPLSKLKSSNWFTGPSWLWQRNLQINETQIIDLPAEDPEVRICLSSQLSTEHSNDLNLNERLSNVSTWTKARNVISRILNLKKSSQDPLGPKEIRKAELAIIRNLQQNLLPEYKKIQANHPIPQSSNIYQADPFMKDGIIRVGGRIQSSSFSMNEKNPIILPKCHITRLIIKHYHEQTMHQGQSTTLNALRANGYWIRAGYKETKKIIRNCVTCRKLRGKALEQRMGDLPEERTEPSPPFTHVGMDCFGPMLIRNGRKEVKRYGILFTCLCSRGVHLEMLDDLTTDACLNALRNLIAIRGPVEKIFCDKGTNFVGADNELRALQNKIPSRVNETEFIFNVPYASHAGGVWERQVKTVKTILTATMTLCPARLDDQSLRTLLYEVMAIVNSRPITYVQQDDPTAPEPLTPNHIITMKSKIPHSPPGDYVKEDMYLRKRWRRVQFLAEQFWSRWKKEYVLNISKRQKWLEAKQELNEGAVVMIADENSARNQWPLGKVVKTHKGNDGLIRSADVQIASKELDKLGRRTKELSILKRPVQKLVLLL